MSDQDDTQTPSLESYGHLIECRGDIPNITGYDEWVSELTENMEGNDQRSFILIGESGIGKTSILYEFFGRCLDKGWRIIETSTAEIMQGVQYVGDWQTRFLNMVDQATVAEKVLIYLKDVHNLRGSGSSSKSDADMAGALIPKLERGEVIVIGECSPEAFKRGVETVPGLKRLITPFQVPPLEKDEVIELVKCAFDEFSAQAKTETGYQLTLPQTTIASLEQLSGIYFSGTSQPGAAIDLLRKIVEIRSGELKKAHVSKEEPVDLENRDIVTALHRISGLPLHLLDDDIPLDLKQTRKFFDAKVVGQDAAITALVDLITLIKAGLTDPGKPTGIMLFAGPTGVGKTEVAKALAEFLFGSSDRMIRCDMSEYKDYNSYERFLGRSNQTVDTGSLVSRVRRQPFSIILLDEVEKAHPNIFDTLLQAFDDGRLTDSNGDTTDLTQTIIIMTSNLGSDLSRPKPVGFDREPPASSEMIDRALQSFFRPEFLNRIDHILRFKPLRRDHIQMLARRELGKALLRNGLIRRELRVAVEPEVHDYLARRGYDERYGARPLRRQVEKLAVLPVAREIIALKNENRGSLLHLTVKDGEIAVKLVEDRQTRTAQKMVQGINLVDPVDGSKEKISIEDLQRGCEELSEASEKLQIRSREEDFESAKSGLLAHSSSVDFWDDQERARKTLGEIYRLERLIGAIERVGHLGERLQKRVDHVRRNPDEGVLRSIALELRSARQYTRLVAYAVECREKEDRRDTFISVRLVDDSASADLVHDLVECYRQWTGRKDYTFRIIHEEKATPDCLREVVFEVGGPAAYGIFRAEEGEHEFIFGKNGNHPRRNHFVCVRVLGTALKTEIRSPKFRFKGIKEPSRFSDVGTVHSQVSVTDPVSGRIIEICSPLQGDELKEVAVDFLAAEIEHTSEDSGNDIGAIIRKYRIHSGAEIKDQRSPELEIKPRDFWRGEIDELLQAGIEYRSRKRAAETDP
ncbi:MAG: AAA family ATPase [Verrucomicrobiales bacterium]|nr:AAA family ATPase [Verrucomicrobiales bacterium]